MLCRNYAQDAVTFYYTFKFYEHRNKYTIITEIQYLNIQLF